ncbi:MAG: TRAP transporter small permease [Arhodomonas sp.]|nr:TRAP transporter small permease [Arhodomonas sp.]
MKRLQRIENVLAWLTGIVATAFLLFLMLGTTLNVASRFVLGSPIPGVFELSALGMAVTVMFGLGWAQQRRKHIRVTFIAERLPPGPRAALEAFAWVVTAALLVLIAIPSSQEAYHSMVNGEFRWGIVNIPVWWVRIIIALGLWLAALQMLKCAIEALLYPHRVTGYAGKRNSGSRP